MPRWKDYANIVLILLEINSVIGGIQEQFAEGTDNFFGFIDIGIYEWVAICLCIMALLLFFNKGWKKWVEKYLDELTGKAKAEREHRKCLELADRRKQERREEKAREENRKRIAREEIIKVLRGGFIFAECDSNDLGYCVIRSVETLGSLGFVIPSIKHKKGLTRNELLETFLTRATAAVEAGTEADNFNLWNEILGIDEEEETLHEDDIPF